MLEERYPTSLSIKSLNYDFSKTVLDQKEQIADNLAKNPVKHDKPKKSKKKKSKAE